MTEQRDDQDQTRRPPRINGPAMLVFGALSLVIGLSIDFVPFTVAGITIILVGAYGVWAMRRYEKAEGIEETLPGGGRYDAHGNLREKDE